MKIELHSNTWEVVRAKANAGIEASLRRLEMPMDLNDTNIERGKILALRDILSLATPADDQKLRALSTTAEY
jgi:hypothetical protein